MNLKARQNTDSFTRISSPPPPHLGIFNLSFRTSKTAFYAHDRKNTNDDNDGCNENYDCNFDDNHDRNYQKKNNYKDELLTFSWSPKKIITFEGGQNLDLVKKK